VLRNRARFRRVNHSSTMMAEYLSAGWGFHNGVFRA
jgi:hypothetical protein